MENSSEEEQENTIFSSEEDEVEASLKNDETVRGVDESQVKSLTQRRRSEDSTGLNCKRAKKGKDKEEIEEEATKRSSSSRRMWSQLIPKKRMWSQKDEISLLRGIIAFKAKRGKSPSEDGKEFYNFVKNSISLEVSLPKYMEKIRTLKRRYMNKSKKSGEPSFLNANDEECFNLSKMIWEAEEMALEYETNKSERSKTNKEDLVSSPNGETQSDWFEKSVFVQLLGILGVDEDSVKERWSKVPDETKKKFEEMWKLLKAKEFECLSQKTNFLHQVTSIIAKEN